MACRCRRRGAGAKHAYRRSVGRLALAVSATLTALFGSSRAFAKGSGGGVQVKGVSAGSATVQQSGRETRITASSQNTVIDYSSFNLGRRQTADFVLPGRTSRILNRIDSATPSHIDGHVLSNGTVYFVNPAGVIFGPTAVIDVAGLYAAAAHLSNQDFLAGINHFTGAQGAVVNNGHLKGDVVALVGRQVTNNGVILGKRAVTVVAGDDVLLGDRFGNIYVKVTPPATAAAPAPGAPTAATSLGSGDMYSLAIVNAGMIAAPQVQAQAGAKGQGGSAKISGHVDASSATGQGGSVTVTADTVNVTGATIDASGKTGGGAILIGGDAHGAGSLQNANTTTVDATSTLRADATGDNGAGGKVVVWSDNSTGFHGAISARGGSAGGDGGFVETSGHSLDTTGGSVNASAPHGTPGVWLLDPIGLDITTDPTNTSIDVDLTDPLKDVLSPHDPTAASKVSAAQLLLALDAGTSVMVQTTSDGGTSGNGKISVNAPIGMTGAGDATLTLKSVAGIDVNQPISSTGGKLGVTLSAVGGVQLNAAVTTNGGDFNSQSASFTSSAAGKVTAGAGTVNVTTTAPGGPLQVGGDVTAATVNLSAVGSVTFGPGGVAIHADTQSYQALNASSHDGQLDLTTHPVTFTGTNPTAKVSSFSIEQDLALSTSAMPWAGGPPANVPETISLKSSSGDVTVDSASDVFQSSLTLSGKNVVTGAAALTLSSLDATALDGGVTTIGGDVTTRTDQAYTGKVRVAAGPIALSSTIGQVTFNGTITGTADGGGSAASALSVTSGGAAGSTFAGGTSLQTGDVPLASLTVVGTANVGGLLVADVNAAASNLSFDHGVNLTGDATLKGAGLSIPSGQTIDGTAAPSATLTLALNQATTVGGATSTVALVGVKNLTVGDGAGDRPHAVTVIAGDVVTSGTQTYNDPVRLQDYDPVNHTAKLTAGTVTLNNTVQDDDATKPVQLLIGADLVAKGGVIVGGADAAHGNPLTDLTVGGTTTVQRGATLTAYAATADFKRAVGGASGALTLHTTGLTKFEGLVDLQQLQVDGATEIDAAGTLAAPSITTTGAQTYGDKITLQVDAVLEGDQLAAPSIDANGHALGLVFARQIKIVAAGDSTGVSLDNLKSLTVGNPSAETTGSTELDTNLTTTADVSFNDPLNLGGGAAVKIKAGTTATFNNTVDGSVDLTVDAAGLTTFKADVGSAGFPSLNVTGATSLAAGASTAHVTTSGDQTYGGGLTLNAAANLQGNALKGLGGTSVLEANGGAGNNDLTLVFKQNLTVDAAILKDVNNLTVGDGTGATTIAAGAFQTTGAQVYNDPVKLAAGGVTLKAVTGATGTAVTFNNTVDNAGATAADLELDNTSTFAAHVGQQQGALGSVVALDDVKFTVAGNLDVLKLDAGTFDFRKTLANGNAAAGAAVTLNAVTDKLGGDVSLGALDVTGTAAITVASANVTTTGDQTFHNAVTLTHAGDVNFSAGNAIDFNAALTGAASDVKVNSVGTATTFNGNVNVDSLVNRGRTTVATGSITAVTTQVYENDVTLAASPVTLNAAAVTFGAKVDGASALTVNAGTTNFSGNVGSGAPLSSLTVIGVTANTAAGLGIHTTGDQVYNTSYAAGGVQLGGDLVLDAGTTVNFITLQGNDHDLLLKTGGWVTVSGDKPTLLGAPALNDNVLLGATGSGDGVNNLTVGVDGDQTLAATASVRWALTTNGQQTFFKPVGLTDAATLKSVGGSPITFRSTVDNAFSLVTDTGVTGVTNFERPVGNTAALASVDVKGTSLITGGLLHTAGDQHFEQAVTVTPSSGGSTLFLSDAGSVTFDATLSGVSDLSATAHNNVTFGGAVTLQHGGASTGSLATSATLTNVNGLLVHTDGSQNYGSPVRVGDVDANTLFTAGGPVTFNFTLFNGVANRDVRVTTAGDTTFAGVVDLNGNLITDAGGLTFVRGGLVRTGGSQDFQDEVHAIAPILVGNTTFISTGSGDIRFESQLIGAGDVIVNTAGHTRFEQAVTVTSGGLTTDAPGVTNVDGLNVTTDGAQLYGDPVVVGNADAETLFTAGGTITFSQTLTGGHPDRNVHVTAANTTTFGGAVTLEGNLVTDGGGNTVVNGGTVQTRGSQDFADAVKAIPAAGIDPAKTTFVSLNDTAAPGTIHFHQTLDATGDLTITSDAEKTFDGAVTVVAGLNAGGNLLSDGAGNSAINGGSVTTDATQHFTGTVTVNPTASGATTFRSAGNQAITFDKSLTGQSDVSVRTFGTTTFGGQVILTAGASNGSTGSLTTDGNAADVTNVNGGLVRTDGSQHFADDVVVNSANPTTLFESVNDSTITFDRSVTGGGDVTVTTGGLTTFGGLVNLDGSLTTDGHAAGAPGTTLVKGRLVRTTGPQEFFDDVSVVPDAAWPATVIVPPQPLTLFTTVGGTPQPVHFHGKLTGTGDVTVTAAGTTTFGGIVDLTGSLVTDGGADAVVEGGLVRTGGSQGFFDTVQVQPAAGSLTLFTSTGDGPIHFHQQLTGSGDVTVTTGGLTTFDGIVDISGSLTTNAGGITAVNGGLVNTGGSQDYFDAVTIAARPTLFQSTGDLDVHFHSTLTGPGSATVTTGGTTWFDGYVDIGGSLLTDGGGDTQVGGQLIRTGAFQNFADRVVLAPLGAGQPPLVTLAKALTSPVTAFISTGNDKITFEKSLTGAGSADVTTAGLTTFGGKVDITADLFTDGGGDTVVQGGLVRTGGTQDFADDVVLTPNAALQPPEVSPSIPLAGPVTVFTSTGNKAVTFERTLTGAGSAEIATAGLTTLGGPVNVSGDLLTDGGGNTAVAGRLVQTGGEQDFFDDVVVTPDPTWGGSDPHGVTGIPASGNTLFASAGNDAITFERTLKGTSNVTVNTGGMTTFKGEVNLVGSLTTDAPGTTTIGDPAGPNPGHVTTTSFQLYNDNVVLGTDVHTTSTGGGDITFEGTVTGPHRLQTSTDGQAVFQQDVDIQSLTTGGFSADPAGSVLVNGHGALAPLTIRTSEYQLYHNPVHLGGDATMTSTGAGDVTFEGTVDGPHNLIVNTAGVTTFFKTVDVGTLVTDAAGKTVLKGGIGAGFTVRTAGYQDYNDDVEIAAATTFLGGGGDIASHKTLKGDFDALVTTAGQTTLHGAVDVGSLTTDGGGLTVIGDPAVLPNETIHTTRFQTYEDAVSLGTDALLTAGGDVTFATTVDGPHRLVVNTPADEIFGGAVNIGSLLTDQDHQGSAPEGAHGFTRIRGGVVTTTGVQLYGDDVKIETANATLTAGDDVTFFATVKGTPTLAVNNTVHTTTFDGAVDVGALTTDAGGVTNINGGSVNTSAGDQLYQDDTVVLAIPGGGVDKLTSPGNITFRGFVHGDQTATGLDATVATSHTLEFDKDVAVAQFIVEKTGNTLINTAHVKTNGGKGNGGQTYRNAVAFTENLILTDVAGQSISFEATSSLTENTSGLSLAINTAGDTFIAGAAKVGTFTSDAADTAQLDGARILGGRTHVSGQLTADKAVVFNDTAALETNGQIVSNGSTVTFNGNAELSADAGLVQTKVGGNAGAVEFNGQVSRGAGITWVVTHGSEVDFNQLVNAPTLNLVVDTTLALGANSTLSLRSLQRPDAYAAFARTTIGQWLGDVTFHQDAIVGALAVTARNVTAHAVSARHGDISLQPDPQLTLFPANTTGQNGTAVEQNFLPYSMQSLGASARARRAASGSSTVTPGTIPPSTQWPNSPNGVLTLNGSLDAGGNILLAPAARLDPATGKPIVAAAATIQMIPAAIAADLAAATSAQIKALPAMEITAGGSVVMGPQEKLTVLGSLHLQAGGGSKGPKGTFAEISDVSTFGDLTVSAPAIVVNLRSPGNVLDSLGRASNKDAGVDYFAGGVMLFDGILDAYPSPTSSSVPFTVPLEGSGLGGLRAPTPREVAFGITNGSIGGSAGIASYPFHMHVDKTVTVADFLFQGFPNTTTGAQGTTGGAGSFVPLGAGSVVLDATPDGPSSTAIAGVLAQALPGQLPQPTEDENITGAVKEQLKEMGIHARDLTLAEIVDRAIGRVRYVEVPEDKAVIAPEDLKIAASRIPLGIAEQVLEARYEILGIGAMPTDGGPLEADWKARAAARKEQIRQELEAAFNDYLTETKKEVDDADATEFRTFVENHYDRYANVVNLFDLIRSTLTAAEKKIALTPAQARSCRDALIAGLIPDRTAGKMVMSFLPEDFVMTAGEQVTPNGDQGTQPRSQPQSPKQPAAPTPPADGTSASAVPVPATSAGAESR